MKKQILTLALLIVTVVSALAQAPHKFNYQGVARNTSGVPLASTAIGLRLTIHDGSAGGATVYQETHTPTTNAFGLYNVAVGGGTVTSGTFASINWGGGAKYMEVEIDPAGGSTYTSAGNSQLLSVPYALYSEQTASAASGTANYIAKFTSATALGNSSVVDNGSTVGMGTTTPTNMAKVHVSGVGTYSVAPYFQAGLVVDGTTTASASGLYSAGGWRGVFGHNLGTVTGTEAIGVLGRQEGSSYTGTGYGVKGENTGTGGTANYGVFGVASGSTAVGVGGSISGGGTAVSGKITSGSGIAGKFDGGTSGGYGVIVPNGGSGFGTSIPTNMAKLHVSGLGTYSVSPIYQAGIVSDGGSSSGSASAIYGEAGWRGVYGRNVGASTGVDAIGVAGKLETGSSYTNGYGVKGEALGTGPKNYGVYGNASGATINNYGIYGTNSGTGYAGYFSGNVNITGSITKGSGTFLIDHPLDPENKYLYHSFVESPDMMNVYNGNIVTNASGEATVTMPDYFEVLNRDFRYQLTVIGTFAQAIIMEEMQGNTFKIKTDKPNVKVSWQVTGIRQDKYANAHRVVPEVEKEAQFKGHYLHAAEWGQPHEKSFDAITTPVVPENNMPQGTK